MKSTQKLIFGGKTSQASQFERALSCSPTITTAVVVPQQPTSDYQHA
jgi:hypothetical protein